LPRRLSIGLRVRDPCHLRGREGVVFGGRFEPATITPAVLGRA